MSGVTIDGMPIAKLKVVELKNQLEIRGISKSGKKDELIARLVSHLKEEEVQGRQERIAGGEDSLVDDMEMKICELGSKIQALKLKENESKKREAQSIDSVKDIFELSAEIQSLRLKLNESQKKESQAVNAVKSSKEIVEKLKIDVKTKGDAISSLREENDHYISLLSQNEECIRAQCASLIKQRKCTNDLQDKLAELSPAVWFEEINDTDEHGSPSKANDHVIHASSKGKVLARGGNRVAEDLETGSQGKVASQKARTPHIRVRDLEAMRSFGTTELLGELVLRGELVIPPPVAISDVSDINPADTDVTTYQELSLDQIRLQEEELKERVTEAEKKFKHEVAVVVKGLIEKYYSPHLSALSKGEGFFVHNSEQFSELVKRFSRQFRAEIIREYSINHLSVEGMEVTQKHKKAMTEQVHFYFNIREIVYLRLECVLKLSCADHCVCHPIKLSCPDHWCSSLFLQLSDSLWSELTDSYRTIAGSLEGLGITDDYREYIRNQVDMECGK